MNIIFMTCISRRGNYSSFSLCGRKQMAAILISVCHFLGSLAGAGLAKCRHIQQTVLTACVILRKIAVSVCAVLDSMCFCICEFQESILQLFFPVLQRRSYSNHLNLSELRCASPTLAPGPRLSSFRVLFLIETTPQHVGHLLSSPMLQMRKPKQKEVKK